MGVVVLKRTLVMLLLLLLVISITPVTIVNAQRYRTVGAYIIPAPVGYMYILSHPVGDIVGVYIGKEYKMYYARTTQTSRFFYDTIVDAVLTKSGRYTLDRIFFNESIPIIGVNLPGKNDLVLLSRNGYVYTSTHRIIYGTYRTTGLKPQDGDILITNVIDLTVKKKVAYIVPVKRGQDTVTIITSQYRKTERIADLLGVQETCLAFISHPPRNFPWYGGLIPSPVCTKHAGGVIKSVYNGQPLYTVFSTSIGRHLVYVAFADPTTALLLRMGLLIPLQTYPSVHVVRTTLDNMYIYYSLSPYSKPVMVKVLNGIDSTVTTDNKRACILPTNSKIIFYLGWRNLPENTSQINLEPGEIVVYTVKGSNEYYICRGSMDFLETTTPSLTLPSIEQLHEPIGVSSSKTAFIMLGNGKYYYGKKITIPYNVYEGNSVWLLSSKPRIIRITAQAIWSTPFFWLSLLLGILFMALILQKPKSYPRKIEIVWDISTPPPLEFSDKKTIMKKVSQFIDIFGVCPNDIELAERGVLLPAGDEKPTDEIIVCNFKTNIATEKILREVVKTANSGFWAFKRRGRSYGYLYTIIGDTLIVLYLYKQEFEKEPHELLLNALKSAIRTYIGIPLHTKYHGLIIVATPDVGKKLRDELLKAGVIDEYGRVADIGGYLSIKYPDMDEKFRNRLIEFIKERIPLILVVTGDMRPLITILGEIASQYYEEYLKMRGVGYEE
jgi:hypothetical protein